MKKTIKGVMFSTIVIWMLSSIVLGFSFVVLFIFQPPIDGFWLILGSVGMTILITLFMLRTGIYHVKKGHTDFGRGMITGSIVMTVIWFAVIAYVLIDWGTFQ